MITSVPRRIEKSSDFIPPTYVNKPQTYWTFKGNIQMPIHPWIRLTPSFSHNLVVDVLHAIGAEEGQVICDPFCGVGTALVTAKMLGFPSTGIEVNPFLAFVAKTKLNWNVDYQKIKEVGLNFESLYEPYRNLTKKNLQDFSKKINIPIPKLYNISRWWGENTLKKLMIIKKIILKSDNEIKNHLLVAFADTLIKTSTARYNHVSVTFDEEKKISSPVPIFKENLLKIAEDLEKILKEFDHINVKAKVQQKDIKKAVLPPQSINHVITSPPYPNRFSYIRETRPSLFFLDFVEDSKEITQLATSGIGETWGTATSALLKPIKINNVILKKSPILKSIFCQLKKRDLLMGRYAVKYFSDLAYVFSKINWAMEKGGNWVFVVGNSILKSVEVPTDLIIHELGKFFGFKTLKIERIRHRHSKRGLYEAIIYLQKIKKAPSMPKNLVII